MCIRHDGHVCLDLSLAGRKVPFERTFIELYVVGSVNKLHQVRGPAEDTYGHREQKSVGTKLALIFLVEYIMSWAYPIFPIQHHPKCLLIGIWGPDGGQITKICSGVLLSPFLVFLHEASGRAY